MRTKVNTESFKKKMNANAFRIANEKAMDIEGLAKKNMDPLYTSNSPWSYRGRSDASILSDERSGLARASIHTWINKTRHWIRIGSTKKKMQEGVEGIAGSPVNYFPYLEFGTQLIPPLGMLRKAFDEVIRKK